MKSTVFVFLLCEGSQRPRNEQFPTLHVPRYRAHCPRRPALSPCTARTRPALTVLHRMTAPMPHSPAAPEPATRLARTRPPHCTCSHRTHIARTVLRHRRALPVPDSARLLAEVLKLQGLSFCQSISNFVVGFPNLSKKDVKGLLSRK